MERYLTTGDIAKYCGVHYRTVLRWIKRGELTGYRLPGGGDHRVPIDEFLNFLKSNHLPIPQAFNSDKGHILVVDDEKNMANAIARVLKQYGYKVDIAYNGFQAGLYLAQHRPKLMTLDLSMPGIEGFDIINFVRCDMGLTDIKILVISALAEARLQQTITLGANDYLAKSFANEQLIKKVSQLIALTSEQEGMV